MICCCSGGGGGGSYLQPLHLQKYNRPPASNKELVPNKRSIEVPKKANTWANRIFKVLTPEYISQVELTFRYVHLLPVDICIMHLCKNRKGKYVFNRFHQCCW